MRAKLERHSEMPISVDIKELAAMLGCGIHTARKVGQKAKAKVKIGSRVLYLMEPIVAYLASEAE